MLNLRVDDLPAMIAQLQAAGIAVETRPDWDGDGTDRVIWGSDWPVVNLGAGLPEWIALSRSLLQDLSVSEQDQIAQGNTRRLYRV